MFLDFAAAQQTRPAPTAKAPPAANATVNAAIDIIDFIITSGLLLRQHQRDAEFYTGYRTDRKSASRGSKKPLIFRRDTAFQLALRLTMRRSSGLGCSGSWVVGSEERRRHLIFLTTRIATSTKFN